MSECTVRYRWIKGVDCSDVDWNRVEDILVARGWMSLNRPTSCILLAEDDATGELLGFNIFQFVPYCGPLYVRPSMRGSGLAQDLADKLINFLTDIEARGWIATAESPFAARLCERHKMVKLAHPVYVMVNPGGLEITCPEKTQ